MARLTVETPVHAAPGSPRTGSERFWVWLLTELPAATACQPRERRPVAIVSWTGLQQFLSVARPGTSSSR